MNFREFWKWQVYNRELADFIDEIACLAHADWEASNHTDLMALKVFAPCVLYALTGKKEYECL
jgi:hypothetical protein